VDGAAATATVALKDAGGAVMHDQLSPASAGMRTFGP
jgi:hypothetical protein